MTKRYSCFENKLVVEVKTFVYVNQVLLLKKLMTEKTFSV